MAMSNLCVSTCLCITLLLGYLHMPIVCEHACICEHASVNCLNTLNFNFTFILPCHYMTVYVFTNQKLGTIVYLFTF